MHDDVTMLATFLCPDVTKLQVLATFLLSHVILTVGDGRDMSSSTVPGSADSAPAQNFCPGCEHAWEDRWKRDNSVLADQGYREASQCNYPCKCTNTELRCKAGVNVVKDGCDCCYMCARQQVEGNVYKDGEEFKPDCRRLCSCQNGRHACSTLCPQEDRRPSSVHCPSPRLIEISGKCCREWTCPSHNEVTAQFPDPPGVHGGYTRVSGSQISGISDSTVDDVASRTNAPSSVAKDCKVEMTAWSACSKTCDMGHSTRVSNDNPACQPKQQRRLCLVRPCELQDKHLGGKKCRSTWKIKSTHMSYENCKSVAEYQPKFCSTCKRRKCCTPGRTKTIQMEFTCPDGRQVSEAFMWIKNCECHKDRRCPLGLLP